MSRRAASLALALASLLAGAPARANDVACVPVGEWLAPGGKRLAAGDVLARASKASVVLLGETHDSAEHHRWQLQIIAALHAARPNLVLGFEAFPRRVQPALDRWAAGELTEAEFLKQSDWRNVWRMDPQLYLLLFHFARMNRIPMVALNVESSLTREITQKGYDAVAPEKREGVGPPAPPTDAYLDWLLPIWSQHERPGGKPVKADRNDPEFRRFVESQQTWDRAMAEVLAAAAKRPGAPAEGGAVPAATGGRCDPGAGGCAPDSAGEARLGGRIPASGAPAPRTGAPLVVGVMGTGHINHGYGVPHQLKALGVTDVVTLLPWDRTAQCKNLVTGLADAVFGVAAPAGPGAEQRPRLGVYLEPAPEGVRIRQVEKGSIAEAAGVRDGDIVSEIAGVPAKQVGDLVEVVQRQAPGTWLPLKVRRGSETLELVAKFPAQPR